jgi:proline iminopeptidase
LAVDDKQGHIAVPGGRVWYRRIGEGSGTPLLVLHGGPGSSTLGQDLWLGDLPSEREVVLYDQLGSGRSDKPDDPSLWRVDRFVEELAAVRAALDLEEVCLLGQSWGTMLAASYLATGPSGVQAVIFSSPCLDAVQWEADQRALLARMPEEVRETVERCEQAGTTDSPEYQEAMLAYYHRHVCRLDPWPDIFQEIIAGLNHQVYGLMWGASDFTVTGTLRNFDARPWLPDLEMPVLFTCGEYDEARPETVDQHRRLVPGAAMHVYEGASHVTSLEVPDAYRAVVGGFLAEHAP